MSDTREIALLQRRLYHQRLSQPGLANPAEVVRWFGAIQAQELPGALYAVGLRAPGTTENMIEQAIAARAIVRTWPMRGTIHFIPAEDAQWMVRLLGPRTNRQAASVYRRAGLTDDDFARAGAALRDVLSGGAVLGRKELYARLDTAGLVTSGDQRGLHLLGYWAREGLLCLGPRQGKQPTYTLLDEWVLDPQELAGDAALALLTTRYFTSHGPATAQDFAWWSGLTLSEARRGLAQVEVQLWREDISGEAHWSSAEPRPLPAPRQSVYLLPQYDEYTVAYKQRAPLRDPAFPNDPFLILGPVVVVDGLLVGSWKRTQAKSGVILAILLYRSLNEEQRSQLEQAVTSYGQFVGMPARAEIRSV
jgi:hypothetical protein